MIRPAVIALKGDLAVALILVCYAQTGVLLDAGHTYLLALGIGIIVPGRIGHVGNARGLLVQGHRDAVEDDGLARTCITGNQEYGCRTARDGIVKVMLEVDVSTLNGSDVADM